MPLLANVYLLKDLARLSGHSIHTVKFYLRRGLIQEAGRSPETRFRYFDDATLATLSTIRTLRKQRKSLFEIQHFINHNGSEFARPGTPGRAVGVRSSEQFPPAPSPEPPAAPR